MPTRALSVIVFFLSGFAALLYQVIWQRLLVIFSGADVYSVTIIVAAFMVGLGVGSFAGGRLADRIGARASLRAFAVAELCIGGFGLASKTLYYDVLYLQFPQLAEAPGVAAVVLVASLLWPTFFMGLSLPLLARALTSSLEMTGRMIGLLYGWNTMGAATGAFVGTWVMLPRFGLEHSLWIAAAVSMACAASAAALGAGGAVDRWHAAPAAGSRQEPAPSSDPLSFSGWVLVYGLTGFIALAFEITWFRMLGVILKSTSFTFGTLLGVYLAGLGLGAAWAARRVSGSTQPGRIFLRLQCGVALYAALSTVTLVMLVASGHPIKLVRYLAGYEPVDVQATVALLQKALTGDMASLTPVFDFVILYLVIPALLIGPPTVLMGASFPYLQKASQSDLAGLGRRLGMLLSANVAGSALGAILTGWVFLPRLGTAGTLKGLVALGLLVALPLARGFQPRRPHVRAVAIASAVFVASSALLAMPDAVTLWARLHGALPRQVIVAEDGAGLSLLKAERADFAGSVGVYVNGLGQSWIPYGNVHTALGALPVFIHPAPAHVLVIGLGSGDTAFAAAGRAEVRRITAVEIIGVQRATLQQLTLMHAYPGLVALLSDPRVEHVVGDGRAYLLRTDRRFDIIEADALRPTSAYSGNLYSREYFDLLRRRLAPGGLAVSWAPTERIRRTFLSVFPHVLAFEDIYLGSNTAIPFDPDIVSARAAAARTHFDAAGVEILALLRRYLKPALLRVGPDVERRFDNLNTDIYPRDEFSLPF